LPLGIADTFQLVSELRSAGVTLYAVADNLVIRPDREDVASECYVFALGLAAKLERAAINDRVSAARDRIEAEGGRWGRPLRMARPEIERAVAFRAEGLTVRAIAVRMHVPRSTIARALARAAGPTAAEWARPLATHPRSARHGSPPHSKRERGRRTDLETDSAGGILSVATNRGSFADRLASAHQGKLLHLRGSGSCRIASTTFSHVP